MKFKRNQILTLTAIVIFIAMWVSLTQSINRQEKHWQQIEEPVVVTEIVNIETFEVVSETIRRVTAYNTGDVNQCWGDPCESANGENICLALELGYKRCAANFVAFGTKLQLVGIDWEMECIVTDRMNSRYPNSVDIAMKLDEKQRAKNLGVQHLLVRIIK